MKADNLDILFKPETIAVIGATNKKSSVGYAALNNLIGSDFKGIVYPVNPKRSSVQGVKCFPSVGKIPDKIDLAIIATPANTVPKIVEECGSAGVSGVVIFSSGFKEAGERGQVMFNEIKKSGIKYGMRILGPNCLGIIRPSANLNASFSKKRPQPGRIAFISQSGALGAAVIDWAVQQNVGFSCFVSVGSMVDIGFHDLIDYFGNDPETSSILIYMESLNDARRFLSAARAFARTKPIVVLKAGKTSDGSKAAMSHTGSLTGNDAVFDAAFKRAGLIRVNTIGELFDCAETLAKQNRPSGNRLAIVTNAGGPGVIATDYLTENGGELAKLSEKSIKKLDNSLPGSWSRSNPVDLLGDASPERYRNAVGIVLEDCNIDGVLVVLTPQSMTDSSAVADEILMLAKNSKKIVLASWMGGDEVNEGRTILERGDIPVYKIPENAVRSFLNMYKYSSNLELLYETPANIPHAFSPKTRENKEIIQRIAKEGRYVLTESEAKQLLSNYSIPVAKNGIAETANQAEDIASKIGFPVAMKISSHDIMHKTEVGGVRINIKSKEEARKAFKDIMSSVKKRKPKADIGGVFIEKMNSKKHELIIGCKKDPIFGPAIVFGMGGVAVEVFKDMNVGLPPLNMSLAMRLIEETKIYNLLKGYRGMKCVDIKSTQFLLYKFAYLVADFPEIKEIDINPFSVDEKGGIVLDAKVILDEEIAGKKVKPYSHMVISPYPKQYITRFKMKNGKVATLRPIKPEDEPMEGEMFTKFSKQTQKFRFFGLIKDITHELLIRYTQIDYDREIAIIAEIKERGKKKMAGVVRLIADPYNNTAEFAIVVADPWHHLALGNKLTDYILDIAKERGIKKVFANVLRNNFIMLHIFRKRGFKIVQNGEDSYYAGLEMSKWKMKKRHQATI